jgi:hypothetical protein
MRFRRQAAVLFFGVIGAAPTAAAAESYLVPKQGFECFRSHIEAYRAAKRDPVVVYFPKCPTVDLTAQDLQTGSVDVLPVPGPARPGARAVITLTKSEIDCIALGKIQVLPATSDAVKITIGPCP